MSLTIATAAAPRVRANEQGAEGRLQDLLRRAAGNRAGLFAVYVHLSRLTATAPPHVRRMLVRPFDALAERREAGVFSLANGDLVLICRDVPVQEIDVALYKSRSFAAPPASQHSPERSDNRDDDVASWYDLSSSAEFQRFCEIVRTLMSARDERSASSAGPGRGKRGDQPLDPETLATMGRKLHEIRISDLIRQQTALEIHRSGTATPLFRETYVSIGDLLTRLAPDVDVVANGWLFRHLTQSLDRRLIASVARGKLVGGNVPLSLNLNVSTIATREFQRFHIVHDGETRHMVVEIQLVDVLSDIEAYRHARDGLHAQGYKVLIDGLSPLTPRFLNVRALEADFVKLWWSSDIVGRHQSERTDAVHRILDAAGRAKVILARTDSEQAVKWALGLGIHCFQGYFIDRLATAMRLQPAT